MGYDDEQTAGDAPIVLVVDDDLYVREMIGRVLTYKGYTVATASNGEEAISYLCSRPPPSCILCDLSMPVMDGREFARYKNADPVLNPIPLIVVSGVADLERDPGALQAMAVLPKPVDFGRLLTLIQGVCSV